MTDPSSSGAESGARTATRDPSDLYRLLIESVQDYAIFALDASGCVVSWNAGAQRLKGYTFDEIVGRHFSTFYPADDIAAGKPAMELVVAAREGRFEDEGWRLRKDGTRFWANVVITALRDETGELVGFGKVTRDLTERRLSHERAIADARRVADAEAANRAKAEFLAVMSHELRTPLNAIGGYAELLAMGLGGTVTGEQQQFLERIRRSQQHLMSIINDLLNFSRVDAGQLTYELRPVPLAAVVEGVAPMVAPHAAAKGLEVAREPCGAGVVACADRAKVEQILINLLSNAVKFTPQGGRVTIGCAATADTVELRVSDTGPGIPADKQEAIFEPFVQLGRSLTTGHEGTGLGLAISRQLARAMGGDLTVASVGEGATFSLRLPAL
ncbi:MAG: PAS domain-containing sensor histidine kinase [Gemmatimonadaceae bacterium]